MRSVELNRSILSRIEKYVKVATKEQNIKPYNDDEGNKIPWEKVIENRIDEEGFKFDISDEFKAKIGMNLELESPEGSNKIEINHHDETAMPMGDFIVVGRGEEHKLYMVDEIDGNVNSKTLQMRDAMISRVQCVIIRKNDTVEIFNIGKNPIEVQTRNKQKI